MKKIKLTRTVVFAVIAFSVIDSTNGVTEGSHTTDVQNYNYSSTSLESLIQKDLNCTDKSEGQIKSRRKRYVAFPEGSSFSVGFPLYFICIDCFQLHFIYSLIFGG